MRVLQNSFVGGEIAPNLFGRTDIEVYSHAAKRIHNFDICKTGGLRKRQGTQLLWHSSNADAVAYRIVGYFYDRTRYAALLLYKKQGTQTFFYRTMFEDGTVGEEYSTSLISLAKESDLYSLNIKQIGDTFFFTHRGYRCIKAFFNYDERTVKWEEMEENIPVADAPALTTSKSGFNENPDEGFVKTTRKYGLIGIKNGVYSKASEKSQDIWLYWVAGAKVTIEFTPRWQDHDSYILAYQYAGDWGIISTYYPDTSQCTHSGTTKADNDSVLDSIGVNGITYLAGSTQPTEAWNGEPNELADGGYHSNAVVIRGEYQKDALDKMVSLSLPSLTPVLGVKVWFGGLMRRSENNSTVDAVGYAGKVKMHLCNSDGDIITTWNVAPSYGESAQEFTVDNPVMPTETTHYLAFEGDTDVIIRDAFLLYDADNRTFVDENIVPGSTAGVMQPIGVGDSGMDVDIVDVWEQRLVMASSLNLPFTIWFSQLGDIGNFYTTRPQTPADAFSVTIPTTYASRILHTITSRWFILFTESGEYSVDSSGDGFGFNTITIKKTSAVGAHESITPVVTESTILFVAADARSVYELSYKLEQDAVVPVNRSILASHLTEGSRIKTIAYAKFPESKLLVLLENGTLLSMTYIPEQNVYAWSSHTFGGRLKCIDVQCPGSLIEDDGLETTSVILLTFIQYDDPSKVWVERVRANSYGGSQEVGKAKCADHCGYTSEQFPYGEDPQINVDASVTTLRPEGDQLPPMGEKKSAYTTVLRLNNSGEVTLRPDIDGIDDSSSKWSIGTPVKSSGMVDLITKDAKVLPRVHANTDGRMVIESSDGWPCEILSILYNYE